MTITAQKPVVYTKDGKPLIVAPGTEKTVGVDEWLASMSAWRNRNKNLVDRISVEEFLSDKKAEVKKGLL